MNEYNIRPNVGNPLPHAARSMSHLHDIMNIG